MRNLALLILASTFLTPHPTRATTPQYTFTDLGTLSDGANSYSQSINDLGQVVGWSDIPDGPSTGFLYSNGQLTPVPSPPNSRFIPASINDLGHMAGDVTPLDKLLTHRAFTLINGTFTDIGSPVATTNTVAFGINNHDQVLINANDITPGRAFLFDAGHYTELGSLPGSTHGSQANALNDAGQAVAQALIPAGNLIHTALFDHGALADLGTLPGDNASSATDINESGQIAGGSYNTADRISHAFLYSAGAMTPLGTLPGYPASRAIGINDAGQIVGEAANADATLHRAVLFTPAGPVDLNSLIPPNPDWTLLYAGRINNHGQIIGNALHTDGRTHAYLLTPIPEPSPLLPAAGLAGHFLRRRTIKIS